MSSKFIILVTCLSFLQAFAEDIFLPPNHQPNYQNPNYQNPSYHNPYMFYYMPMLMNDMEIPSQKIVRPKKNNLRMGRLSPYMKPPDPYAISKYSEYYEMLDEDVPYNHRPYPVNYKKNPKKVRDERPKYTREHDPFTKTVMSDNENSQEAKARRKKKPKKNSSEKLQLSPDGDRVEFQIQGHEGPSTYIFGYDTGDGRNRQFRLEERMPDGSVKGHYGYYDARGKLRTVTYTAGANEGYKEKHHLSNRESMEEE